MGFIQAGHYIAGKHPSHIQIVLDTTPVGGTGVNHVYLPVKSFTWDWASEQTPNLHSGSTLPSDLIDGHKTYTVRFTTSTWLTEHANRYDANKWEYLTYTHLVKPSLEGRPIEFDARINESESIDEIQQREGGSASGTVSWFRRCKLNKMGYNQGQNGIIERTFEAGCMRINWGDGGEEQGGQS